jgi:hypothetical protein
VEPWSLKRQFGGWLVLCGMGHTGNKYATIQDSPGELEADDISNQRKIIKRLETHQAYETLGVFLAPDGNLEAQFEKMRKAVVKWVDGLQTGKISRDEAWLALQSTILRTLYYPLPALRLTKPQCKAIMAPLLHYCLPAIGVCRFFPRKLVHAPHDYMGLSLLHLHTLQEIARIKDLIFHTFNESSTGSLYNASLELLLLELGCSTSFDWSLHSGLIAILSTISLVQETWQFLYTHGLTLQHSIWLELPRLQDQFLMEAFIVHGVPVLDLVACNSCRMFLRAIFLSDIVTGDGVCISEDAWNGNLF